MVIEGVFNRSSYEHDGGPWVTTTLVLHLKTDEALKLQNALMNRRMDQVQLVVNSARQEVESPTDTPKTTTESW